MTTNSDRSVADEGIGELVELEIGAPAAGGGFVARDDEGRVVFVRHALPGERVRARITAVTQHYRRADAIEIVTRSPDRVTAPCEYAGAGGCGGCAYQHVSVAAQRDLKAFLITEQLQRVAGVTREVVVEPVTGDAEGLGWRTRIGLTIDDEGRAGFHPHRSHDVLPITHCPIAHPNIAAAGVFEVAWPAVDELEVMVGTDTVVVEVHTRRRGHRSRPLLPAVRAGVVLNGKTVTQPAAVHAPVGGVDFRVSAGVFWQVHAGAAQRWLDAVSKVLQAKAGDAVVDLYAGAGLFAVLLAKKVGPTGSVVAVERDRQACADLEHNGHGLPQLRVVQDSVRPALVAEGIGRPSLVVLDPAREGVGKGVMAALAGLEGLRRVAYVSCDAASFSRDLRVLLDAGWEMPSLRAFDIFPMTEHVEMVAGLTPPA